MSRLIRVLVAGSMLVVLSLGSAAHAQDAEAPSQPAGVSQPDPSQPQPPGETTPQPPGTPEDPGMPEDPGTTPGSTTTTRPPVARPNALPVTVSPRAGSADTTVTVRADLRGCVRPGSAHGFFQNVHDWGIDGLSKWLTREGVSGGRWYTGQYLITKREPIGLGQFGVVCDNAIVGFATFRVRSAASVSVSVALSQRAGGRGTTVRITAEVRGGCDPAYAFFQDRKGWGVSSANKRATILRLTDRQLVATYTVTRKDAVGSGRFGVSCNMRTDSHRVGYASFRVLAPNGGGSGGNDPIDNPNNPTQFPKRIDTGQGGTADGAVDPTWLLLPAGLLLIALAAALRLRQAATRRRR
jgi:hypothetical protein